MDELIGPVRRPAPGGERLCWTWPCCGPTAAEVGITDITQKAGVVAFTFDSRVDVPSLMAVCTMPGYREPPAAVRRGAAPAAAAPIPGEDALRRRREADGGAAAEKRRTGQSP